MRDVVGSIPAACTTRSFLTCAETNSRNGKQKLAESLPRPNAKADRVQGNRVALNVVHKFPSAGP